MNSNQKNTFVIKQGTIFTRNLNNNYINNNEDIILFEKMFENTLGFKNITQAYIEDNQFKFITEGETFYYIVSNSSGSTFEECIKSSNTLIYKGNKPNVCLYFRTYKQARDYIENKANISYKGNKIYKINIPYFNLSNVIIKVRYVANTDITIHFNENVCSYYTVKSFVQIPVYNIIVKNITVGYISTKLVPTKKLYFKTKDGVDIYEGDSWFYVRRGTKTLIQNKSYFEPKPTNTTSHTKFNNKTKNFNDNDEVYRFSNKENAIKYVDENLIQEYKGKVLIKMYLL
jgi:hypothetical protein